RANVKGLDSTLPLPTKASAQTGEGVQQRLSGDAMPPGVRHSRVDAKTAGAGEKFSSGELALERQPLRYGKRAPRTAEQHAPFAADPQLTAVKYQEAIQPAFVEGPIPHRSGVDMDKAGMRVPADAAAFHGAGRGHRVGEPRSKMQVERPAIDMLAVLGHSEHRAREHRIGLGRAVGGEYRRPGFADRVHDTGQKVDHTDVDLCLFTRVMVAQKNAKLVDHPLDRAVVVAVGAVKSFTRVGVDEAKAAQ